MDKSRIVRSIIAVILNIINIILIIFCVKGINETQNAIPLYIKIIYIVICAISLWAYNYVKKQLTQKILYKKLIYIYRYGYLATIIFMSRFIMSYVTRLTFDTRMAAEITITLINVIIIKKIIFNISTSDLLATITSIIYIFTPQILFLQQRLNIIEFKLTFFLIGIYLILKIVDQVSQKKLKNSIYIYLTIMLCICIGINMFLGGIDIFWIILILITLMASKNIDFTHITFGEKLIGKIKNIKIKRIIYKIERVTINKLTIVFIITTLATIIMSISIKLYLAEKIFVNACYLSEITTRLNNILRYSRGYYLVLIVITLICEIIGIVLKRKVDLKTTIVKSVFVMGIFSLLISASEIYVSQLFDVLVIFNLILNIGNIYYNREEKIKLLKEKN